MKNLILFSLVCISTVAYAQGPAAKRARNLELAKLTSSKLTSNAWNALRAEKYDDAMEFTKFCIKSFEKDAVKMQSELKKPVSGDKEAILAKRALNSVGTSYYIMGKVFEKQGKTDDAIRTYKLLQKKFPFAQCWDSKGWFWKPSDLAKKRLEVLEPKKTESADSK